MTRFAISRSQWLALTLIPVLSIALLSSPVVEWFEGPQLLSALLVMAGLVLFATGALPEFVTWAEEAQLGSDHQVVRRFESVRAESLASRNLNLQRPAVQPRCCDKY